MGGALVPKHIFLILLLALSLVPIANAIACQAFNGDCGPQGQDPSLPCCSTLVCAQGLCKQAYGGACSADADCGSGLFCSGGVCKGCNCNTLAICSGVACSSGAQCCSGSCGGSPSVCKRCLGIGDSYQNGMGACCSSLVQDPGSGKCIEAATQGGSGNWYDNIYVWAGLAVLMSAMFLGLAYMASQLFRVQVLEAWVRIELGELVKSMVIAVFCVALIASTNAAAQFLSGESGATDVISASQQFMVTLYSDGHSLYSKLAIVYFNVAKVASYSYTAGTSIGGYATISYSSSPASGMSPLVAEVGQALDSVANFMLLAAAQAAFLKFFGAAALVMLPVGIFLRSFSFTRKLGATLLAATIASAVIYPASVLLSQQVYGTFSPDLKAGIANVEVTPAENPPSSSVVCNTFMQYFVQSPIPFLGGEIGWWIVVGTPICAIAAITGGGFVACMSAVYQIISMVFMIIKALFPILLFASVFMTMDEGTKVDRLMDNYYAPLHDYALPTVAKFTMLSLTTFLIPIIITLSLLRGLATAFGGEAQLYGLSKLV